MSIVDDLRKQDEMFVDDDWPRNAKGEPKLLVTPNEARAFIANGICTDDDLVIYQPIPTTEGTWQGVTFVTPSGTRKERRRQRAISRRNRP